MSENPKAADSPTVEIEFKINEALSLVQMFGDQTRITVMKRDGKLFAYSPEHPEWEAIELGVHPPIWRWLCLSRYEVENAQSAPRTAVEIAHNLTGPRNSSEIAHDLNKILTAKLRARAAGKALEDSERP